MHSPVSIRHARLLNFLGHLWQSTWTGMDSARSFVKSLIRHGGLPTASPSSRRRATPQRLLGATHAAMLGSPDPRRCAAAPEGVDPRHDSPSVARSQGDRLQVGAELGKGQLPNASHLASGRLRARCRACVPAHGPTPGGNHTPRVSLSSLKAGSSQPLKSTVVASSRNLRADLRERLCFIASPIAFFGALGFERSAGHSP